MADEKQKPKIEGKKEDLKLPQGGASQQERESPQQEKIEKLADVKKPEVKPAKVEKIKKTEVKAAGLNLRASLKHCMYISRFIKGKTIDQAISDLQDVVKFKRAVPFRGEIPHRREKGIMSGRYPIAASKQIISVLKGLKGNALAGNMDLDKTRITFANPSWASQPAKRGGAKFKRVNIYFKAKEVADKAVDKAS
ncbi:MAG: uL22 family ribosomal protein [Candidatus Pacearchaeota archaeon]